jgi:hypothetical protein
MFVSVPCRGFAEAPRRLFICGRSGDG